MVKRKQKPAWLGLALATGLGLGAGLTQAGCGHDDEHGDHGGGGEAPEGDPVAPGFAKTGTGGLTAELQVLDPPEPVRGDNTWTVSVRDAAGAATACSMQIEPFMPAHGHGTGKTAEVEDLGDGSYRVTPINLFMRGLWTVDFALDCEGTTDLIRFEVWIEG